MAKKPIKVLVCAKCALPVQQSDWTNHWKRVHKIHRRNARKELVDGQLATNPQWLKSNKTQEMVEVNNFEMDYYSSEISTCLKNKTKIPWHLRDLIYQLLRAGDIIFEQLDWGKVSGTRNVVSQTEKDNYEFKFHCNLVKEGIVKKS